MTACVHFQPRNHFRRGSIRSVWSYTDQTSQIRFLFLASFAQSTFFLFLSYLFCFDLVNKPKQIYQFSAEFPSPRQPHYLGQEANTFKVLSAKRQYHYHNHHHHHPHHNHYPHRRQSIITIVGKPSLNHLRLNQRRVVSIL